MNTFVPEILQQKVPIAIAALKPHEFDVRADNFRDDAAALEIINQGGVKRLPRVFEDGVVFDGRGAALALEMTLDASGNKPTTILCDVIKGRYTEFSEKKKFEVRAASLGENLPSAKTGYCRFATEEDILFTLKHGVRDADISVTDAVKLLSAEGLSLSRIQNLYKQAHASVRTTQVNNVVNYSKKNNCKPEDAVAALGLPAYVMAAVKASAKDWGNEKGPRPRSAKNFIEKNQPMLNSALIAIRRYGDKIAEQQRTGKMSAKTAMEVLKAHAVTAERIKHVADDLFIRISKEIQNACPGTHRY